MINAIQILPFLQLSWIDILDIFLVALLMYQLYQLIKGTVAIRIFVGIISLYFFWKMVEALHMDLLSEILGQFLGVGVLALIIVFQQEIRRFLLLIGTTGFIQRRSSLSWLFGKKWISKRKRPLNIEEILMACQELSKTKTGALIVLAKESQLKYYTSNGVQLNAKVTHDILQSIFFKNNPLHDGATIIVNNRIEAARCILPVSENLEIPAHLGLRHRSGIGITENSSAISIIISEEKGHISIADNGELKTNISLDYLLELLEQEFN